MKKQIALTTLVLGLSSLAFADENVVDMPYQYPDACKNAKSIALPAGAERVQYYFNKDCSVAFVVPPPTGSFLISNPAVSENMKLCPAVESNMKSIVSLHAQISKLTDKLAEPGVTDAQVIQLTATIDSLSALANRLQRNFEGTPGTRFQMRVYGSLTPSLMNSIQIANMPSIESGSIKIRPAQLQKSYLSFNAIIPGVTQTYQGNPVIESNVMGILSRADESSTSRTSVAFNGAAVGFVSLDLKGSCPIMEGDFSNLSTLKLNKEKASNYLSVTNTMMVAVNSSFGYKATLDVNNATDTIFSKFGTNGKFSSTEATELFLTGSASETIKVEAYTYSDLEGKEQAQYGELISADNLNKVRAAMMQEYYDKLTQFNILREITPLVTPQAGNDVVNQVGTRCWHNRGFFGIGGGGGCENYIYQVLVPTDGTSNQRANIVNNLGLTITNETKFSHPILTTHTSVFVFNGGAQ